MAVSAPLKLYAIPGSRSSRVTWALAEAGVTDYEFIAVDYRQGEMQTDEFRRLNPGSKVPVLVHGELVVTESAAIINYVCNQFRPELIPADPAMRAEYDRWCFFVMAELEQGLWTMAKHRVTLPEEYRVAQVIDTAAWEYQQALGLLAQGLGTKPFMLGDEFSAVDILVAHTLLWAASAEQPLEHENLRDYLQRMTSRPGYQAMLKVEGR